MKSFALWALVLAAALSACRKPGPSPDYFEASQSYGVVVARMGDDAYFDPEMGRIEGLLARVPGDSPDAAAAKTLADTIKAERARIKREREAPSSGGEVSDAPRVGGGGGGSFVPTGTVEPAEGDLKDPEADSVRAPKEGMTNTEFQDRYGDCFDKSQSGTMGDNRVAADVYTFSDRGSCGSRLPQFKDHLVVLSQGKVVKVVRASSLRVSQLGPDGGIIVDAGQPQ